VDTQPGGRFFPSSVFSGSWDAKALGLLVFTRLHEFVQIFEQHLSDRLDRGKAQAAFGIVTVPYTHELRITVATQFFGALLAGYQCASGSHGSPSSAKGSATGG
jgi:hypothetical protein